MCWAWYSFSFFGSYVALLLFNFGLIFALVTCKVIISSVTKMTLLAFHV